MCLRRLLTSRRHAMRIDRGGFRAFRRFIAFFISSQIVFAFGLRPQIFDQSIALSSRK